MKGLARNAVLPVAVGLWSAAWSALPYSMYRQLDEPLRSPMLEAAAFVGSILSRRLGVSALSPLALQTIAVFAAAAVAAAIWRGALRRLDSRFDSAPTVRWSLGSMPMLALWSAGLFAGIALALHPPGDLGLIGWPIAVGVAASLPLLCWRGEIVDSPQLPRFWAPAWPGLFPAGFAVLMAALYWALTTALDIAAGAAAWARLAAGLTEMAIASALLVAAGAPWLSRAPASRVLRMAADALRIAPVRAAFAIQWRIHGWFALILGPAVLAMAWDQIHLAPQAAASFASIGQDVPLWLSRWTGIESWLVWSWHIPVAAAQAWLVLLCTARALRRTNPPPHATQ